MPDKTLNHLDESGNARMVDVSQKSITLRTAIAKGQVTMQSQTLAAIQNGLLKKGDVLAVAQLAGVMAAKRTPDLIPLCHPLPLDYIHLHLEPDEALPGIRIVATVQVHARTGVEMEALTAVSVAALTIYDMAKSVDKTMQITDIRLIKKTGGRSGDVLVEES